ncbi:hypothetical protein CAPTEDRAFT_206778 [Capitella teleta]|uniref:Large ribosomal subunit protein eL14 n=1 Tax=Capitella teleta TaxID=283909 RepID=R7U516_CAPTE|nr:hypothetical protein CAPTEDRAFT_206778 [Capitella teleta]|eukprot:ELU01430.1 hypothetical protein CAPTEDRAFT_206778 [Capitella teleta]
MATFNKYVQIGRVTLVAYGPDQGNLVVIIDVIDHNRALVDGPCTGVKRQALQFKGMHLTKFVIPVPRSARTCIIKKKWEKSGITEKWQETFWSKRLNDEKLKKNMNDFDRFKLMKAKQTRNRIINMEFGRLKNLARKQAAKK